MNKTHGDTLYSPTTNGPTINDLIYQKAQDATTIGSVSSNIAHGQYNPPRGEVGWICPICGRGLAPSTSYCPCHLNNNNIVYLNGGVSILDNLPKEINCNSTPPEAHFATTATQK